jgi:hypothetical protein
MKTLIERLALFIRGLRVDLRGGFRVLLLIGVFVGGLWLGGGRGGSEVGFLAKVREMVEGRLGGWVSELKLLAGLAQVEGEGFAMDLRGGGCVWEGMWKGDSSVWGARGVRFLGVCCCRRLGWVLNWPLSLKVRAE